MSKTVGELQVQKVIESVNYDEVNHSTEELDNNRNQHKILNFNNPKTALISDLLRIGVLGLDTKYFQSSKGLFVPTNTHSLF